MTGQVRWSPPELPGVMSAVQTVETAAAIAQVQQPDGGIPWAVGEHIDAWNHVESAMALMLGGEVEAAEAAYEWCLATQRPDGSWPMKVIGTAVEDASGDTNMSAYLAVGTWHHWLLTADRDHVRAVLAGGACRARLRRRHAAALRGDRLVPGAGRHGQP